METSTGVMKTGFFRDANGGLYYSDGSGAMVGNPGWNVIGGKWYWMNSNGSIYSGWLSRPSGWYYRWFYGNRLGKSRKYLVLYEWKRSDADRLG